MMLLISIPVAAWIAVASAIFIATYTLFAVYLERKVSAWIQDRLGPMEVGPKGLFQTAADITKLVFKEQIIPKDADKVLFASAPVIIFVSVFAGFAVLPFANGLIGSQIHAGALYLLAIISLDVIGILLAGWGSNNKYSFLGGLRSVSQIISYEIAGSIALLAGLMMFGTLNLQEVSLAQGIFSSKDVVLWGMWDVTNIGGITGWTIIRYPHLIIGFGIFFVAALAESNRAPFDLPEAESELVGGFHTEYSGSRFAFIFLAEYGMMFLTSVLALVVFLGGWNTILPNLKALPAASAAGMSVADLFSNLQFARLTTGSAGEASGILWGIFWILIKAFGLIFFQMWIRWTLPRVRPDQLIRISWKILTPAALALFVISAIWKLMEVYAGS